MAEERGWAPMETVPPPTVAVPASGDGPVERRGGLAGVTAGPLSLHPMTVADVLDGSFTLLKANARNVILLAAIFVVPTQLLGAFLSRDLLGGVGLIDLFRDPSAAQAVLESGQGGASPSSLLVSFAARVLVLPVQAGVVCALVAGSLTTGRASPAAALRTGLRRWWSLVLAWILVHLAELVGGIFFVLPGLLMMAFFVPVVPVIVIEGVGAFRALSRSARLVSSRVMAVLGVALLSGIVAGAVSTSLGVIPQAAAYLVGLDRGWLILAAGTTLTSLVTTPLIAIVATLVYFDGRVRQEGLDLQLMVAGLAGQARAG